MRKGLPKSVNVFMTKLLLSSQMEENPIDILLSIDEKTSNDILEYTGIDVKETIEKINNTTSIEKKLSYIRNFTNTLESFIIPPRLRSFQYDME